MNREKYTYLVDPQWSGQMMVDLLNERCSWKVEKGYPKSSYKSFYPRMLNNEWNLIWKPTNILKPIGAIGDKTSKIIHDIPLPAPLKKQIINHFRNSEVITRKDNLIYTLDKYYSSLGRNIFDVIPETFVVNSYTKDRYLSILRNIKKGYILIVKPENDYGGHGIHLVDNYEDLIKLTNDKIYGNLIIQRYISNPLLIRTPFAPLRKFDVRVHVLVDETFKIYCYKEAIIRMSSEEYKYTLTNDFDLDKTIHITNYTFQKTSPLYEKYEVDNIHTLKDLQKYIAPTISVEKDIVPQWHKIIIDSIEASKSIINGMDETRHSFELFGYDFLIDDNYKVWLIEINQNPAGWPSLLKEEKIMRDGAFKLTIDKLFPPRFVSKRPNKWIQIK